MKIRTKIIALLALAGFGLAAPAATAATVAYSNTTGDLLLGFRATGGTGATQTYLVNLGAASAFRDYAAGDPTTSFVVNTTQIASGAFTSKIIGDIGADLAATFGADWYTRADLFWSVSGATQQITGTVNGDPLKTVYATKGENTFGTVETSWDRGSPTAQGTPNSKILAMGTAYNGDTSTANSNHGVVYNHTDINSYEDYMPGGSGSTPTAAFSYFAGGIEGNFGNGVLNGATNAALDLFRLQSGTGAGTYEGSFTISNTGALSFGAVSVPEPSRALLVAMGACGLVLRRRRPAAKA